MQQEQKLLNFFIKAYDTIMASEYSAEVDYVKNIPPIEKQDAITFYIEYVYVVLNAGMKEQTARKIFERFFESYKNGTPDFDLIKHPSKRKAIEKMYKLNTYHFNNLQDLVNYNYQNMEALDYLELLDWIGPITKYHLARNIGIDTIKPDRHLTRLADQFGFYNPSDDKPNPFAMCACIQRETKLKLGVIDIILWRYCNLFGSEVKK